MMRRVAVLVVAAGAFLLAGCSGDDNGGETEMDLSDIPAVPPEGERLCEFLPRQTVALALGTDDFEVTRGDAPRDGQGELVYAACHVALDGQDADALDVSVDWAQGAKMSGFEQDLRNEDFNQLPEEDGLGFSWKQTANRPDGSRGDTARAWLVRGDRLIDVWITMPVEGRDGEADAAAIAQQVVQTLNISDEWTLPGDPPSR
ncbi:hypothetical protein [Phytoactinopolyspora mesophila]|uniref:DUF3558 domain-containing protein n=1 Tax=Phytoactinopolyspora mesophila TaxID=2650750 RepID=A0A7K3M6N5_9ACTN|nr:hypothetical protein [Phytoactinopolyspora mesophila]NDL58936.1 hypothetical protein [Phytoactinopolyspora mesophila]